jgi:hypothetical protein
MPPAFLRQTLDGGGLQLHFGEGGQFLGTNSATNAFYRVTATRTPAPGATNHFRQQAALRVAYPPPTFHETKILPVSFFAYGTQF